MNLHNLISCMIVILLIITSDYVSCDSYLDVRIVDYLMTDVSKDTSYPIRALITLLFGVGMVCLSNWIFSHSPKSIHPNSSVAIVSFIEIIYSVYIGSC